MQETWELVCPIFTEGGGRGSWPLCLFVGVEYAFVGMHREVKDWSLITGIGGGATKWEGGSM